MHRLRVLSLALMFGLLAACGGGGGGGGAADLDGGSDYDAGTGGNRDLAGVTRTVPTTMGALEAI